MFQLAVENGPHAGQVFNVPASKSIVGRSPDAALALQNDPTVSRSHLELSSNGTELFVRDLGSPSGTFVNGSQIAANMTFRIKAGDRLRLGQTVAQVRELQTGNVAPPPVMARNTNACSKCGSSFAFLGGKARNGQFQNLCNECAKELLGRVERFRKTMQNEFTFWNGLPSDLTKRIDSHCQSLALDRSLALSRISDLTAGFLQRVLTFMLLDGHLSEDEEKTFHQFRIAVNLSGQHIPELISQLRHYAFLRDLRAGKLPTIRPSVMMPAGEIAHIEAPVTYLRELASGVRYHNGVLVVTNSRLIFTNTDAPFEVALSKVVGSTFRPPHHLDLQLTRKQGTGFYASKDAFYLVEVLRAVLGFHLRHRVLHQSASRAIPQDVKSAVWARDGGRRVQCGESKYLEFDHIIPFSKGGASSINNLQLLCRQCNLTKQDNI
ncbi:MAG TPA: FHA domain-containing protein [Fimbriimonadaceae bacterium]|nr:FHA domain-containing protein [Fimbriimonadaceae bacterium]